MNKKMIFPFFLTFVFFLSGCDMKKNDNKNPKNSKNSDSNFSEKDYENYSKVVFGKVSYYVPKDWEKSGENFYQANKDSKKAGNNFILQIMTSPVSIIVNEEFCDMISESAIKSFKSSGEIEPNLQKSEFLKTDEKDSCALSWKNLYKGVGLIQDQLIVFDNNNQYTFTITQIYGNEDEDLDEMIFKSIRFE